jgi:ATP-binding cassette subfamily C (CFTR/MRP) protein 4
MSDTDQVHNDQDGIQRSQNPLATASFLSKMCFMWPYDLIKEGAMKPIEESDLHDIMQEEKSSHNRECFEKLWQDEIQLAKKRKRKPSLHWALAKYFFKSTWIIQPLMCASSIARIVMSVALGYLIQSFNDKSYDGYLWAAIIVLCDAIRLLEHHQVFFMTWRKGMQIRIGAVSSIFAKSLRLKSVGITTSSGQIMNLISNDVERFLLTTLFVSYIIWAPLQAIAILIIGTKMIGPAFTIGIGLFMFVFVPLQSFLAKRFASLRSKVAYITDERMTLVGQAITGVRVMKMFGWEHEFESRINRVRQREIKQIHKANRLKALNEALFFAVNVFVSVTIFVIHVYGFDGSLTTRNVFVVITLMSVLQLELAKHLSLGVMAVSECFVSVTRIQKYLETSELSNSMSLSLKPSDDDETDIAVRMKEVTCYWDSNFNNNQDLNDSKPPALKNVSLDFKRSCLTCIVGSVGSGKSALILALAGELVPQKGTIEYRCKDSLSYAPQDPWIMNGTIRKNILMGKPYDFEFYRSVCDACGLAQDFGQFMSGDETIVGDRGVQISGGQRARYVSFEYYSINNFLI